MMRRMRCNLTGLCLAAIAFTAGSAGAQQPVFFYPAPAAGAVIAARDIDIGAGLKTDIRRPVGAARAPALIIWRSSFGAEMQPRDEPFFASWARAAAANGL